jgi:20S proteasome subunit alpha 5
MPCKPLLELNLAFLDVYQVATSEGVILGVEKRVTSTLLETSSVEKIVEIDQHIGCAMSGLQADARSMIEHARVESQNHAFHFAEPLRVESCTQAICDLALRFGEGADGEESIMSRPFGVALLIAGYDEDGPQLYASLSNVWREPNLIPVHPFDV